MREPISWSTNKRDGRYYIINANGELKKKTSFNFLTKLQQKKIEHRSRFDVKQI